MKRYRFHRTLFIILISFFSIINAQNSENSKDRVFSILRQMYPTFIGGDFGDTTVVYKPDTLSNISYKLKYSNWNLIDAGLNIFPSEILRHYDFRIINYIERELLLILLEKEKYVDHGTIVFGIEKKVALGKDIFKAISSGKMALVTGFNLNERVNDKKRYYLAELQFEKLKLDILFPARVDLISSASWENLSNDLSVFLKNGKFEKKLPQKFVPIIEKQKSINKGLYEDVLDTMFISGVSKIYYVKEGEKFVPVASAAYPFESLNNAILLQKGDSLENAKINLKIKKYGGIFDSLSINLFDLISAISVDKITYITLETSKSKNLVVVYFYDKKLNYSHLLFFEVKNFSVGALTNNVLKGYLYPFLRLDNIQDINKEFDPDEKSKWNIPLDK